MNPKYYLNIGDAEEEVHSRLWFKINSGEKFALLGPQVEFGKGQIVAAAGKVPQCCYYVLEGRVMAYEYTSATGTAITTTTRRAPCCWNPTSCCRRRRPCRLWR